MVRWSKHLDSSDECPKIDKNKLTLFNMRYCPYAQRTVLALEAKKIPYDMINVNLKDRPQWFLNKNPMGKVPTIQVGDEIFYESHPVNDYLDEVFPGRKLNPAKAEERAKDRMFLAHYDNAIGLFYKIILSESDREENIKKFNEKMEFFEKELAKRESKFLSKENEPGMLDYMTWPWMERVEIIPSLFSDLPEILPTSSFPRINAWIKAMKEDPVVHGYILTLEEHTAFFKSYMEQSPNYDPQ
uniref:Glutathione S-transferase omega n=1 Tax=Paracyclopina nana TaxID=565004 RepID=H2B648_PARNA